jgi:hypothetical protein
MSLLITSSPFATSRYCHGSNIVLYSKVQSSSVPAKFSLLHSPAWLSQSPDKTLVLLPVDFWSMARHEPHIPVGQNLWRSCWR